ncbi:MAG: hypothetical protein K2G82_07450, partial [Paramuribaculum sp.]|nr:hypothetical protein [Paramuribaculum sp.]
PHYVKKHPATTRGNEKYIKFALHAARRSPVRVEWEGCSVNAMACKPWQIHNESVYSALFLDRLKPGKFQLTVRNETTVDGLCGYVHYPA